MAIIVIYKSLRRFSWAAKLEKLSFGPLPAEFLTSNRAMPNVYHCLKEGEKHSSKMKPSLNSHTGLRALHFFLSRGRKLLICNTCWEIWPPVKRAPSGKSFQLFASVQHVNTLSINKQYSFLHRNYELDKKKAARNT